MTPKKTCTKCGEDFPATNHYFYYKKKGVLKSACKRCELAKGRAHYHAGRGKIVTRAGYLRRTYNMTLEEYEAMFEQQGGLCAICESPEPTGKLLAIDHCHKHNTIRGLLCINCNLALGTVNDSQERLHHSINYLEKHSTDQQAI